MPMHVRERITVQQEYRRAITAVTQIDLDFGIAGWGLEVFETFEQGLGLSEIN
jgi:hypothetical protein